LNSVALLLRPSQGIMTVIAGAAPSACIARRLLVSALAVRCCLPPAPSPRSTPAYPTRNAAAFAGLGNDCPAGAVDLAFRGSAHEIAVARTRAEQELQGALQQLRDERDCKDVFLATLAHELHNPLAPIQSAAEVLHHMRDPDKARLDKVSSMILRQVDNMVNLVDDLMDVSRIGRGQLDIAPINVRMAITDAVE
jgi:signal transduction histidine kinase